MENEQNHVSPEELDARLETVQLQRNAAMDTCVILQAALKVALTENAKLKAQIAAFPKSGE